jgi:glycosyltransferase involved in cell wall biosynthesis
MFHETTQLADITETSRIRVAHLLSGSKVWGVENYVHNLLSSQNATMLQPSVICTKVGVISEKFANSGFQVSTIPMRNYFDVSSISSLSNLFESKQIDLVHVHLGLDSFIGTLAAKKANKPVIMTVHFDQPNHMNYSLLAKQFWNGFQKLKNQGIAHFLPITENVATELMRREAVPREKITVIHPGIPLFETDKSSKLTIRHELNCDENDVVIIGIGRLEPEKNFSCLLNAVANMNNEKSIKVWIIGDGSERSSLSESIRRIGLGERVQLLGYRNDVIQLLGAADIFVLPSKAEPFGMSAVEAMIARLPVVGTNGPGLGTIVDHEVTGLLVQADDSVALATALSRLVNDRSLRIKLAEAGRERAAALFSSDGMADKMVKVYRNVISAHRQSSATKF